MSKEEIICSTCKKPTSKPFECGGDERYCESCAVAKYKESPFYGLAASNTRIFNINCA